MPTSAAIPTTDRRSSTGQGTNAERVGVEFIALLGLMMGITALSVDIMLPALPQIEEHYKLDNINDQQLVIVSYMLGFGLGQLIFGPFSDRFGRKPVLFFGMSIYMGATIAAVTAVNFELHLIGRLIQGAAGGAGRVIAVAIVRDRFAGRAMARVMSFVMMIFIMIPVVAPAIGAGLLLFGPWQWTFWFLLGVAVILVVWMSFRLVETRPEEKRTALTFGTLRSAAAATVTNRQTLCYMVTVGLTLAPLLAYIATSQQIFVGLYRIDAWFPVAFGGVALCTIAASLTNARLVQTQGMRRMSHGAILALLILALLLSVTAVFDQPPLFLLLAFLGASFFAVSLCFPNFNALAMEPHGAIVGTASSIVGFTSTVIGSLIGWAIGMAYDGTVLPLTLGFAACAAGSIITILLAEPNRFMKKTV
ncbi:MAG: multidrug effflux MFS transporter [Rhodospirillaceae bacterium]|nr:multidrug effflux MFS transporter [Rhodospirillaceae bacterium]